MPPAGGKASRDDAYHDIPCSAGHNSCYISPYADVFPCVQMPHPAGNLRRQTFAAIWHDAPQLQEVRALRESDLPVCRTCDLRPFCERCPGSALVEHGDLTAAVARACELAEVRARLAGVVDPVSAWHRQNIPRGLPPVRIH
jgi:radical SAM protein with 4Fe4S-binding SPASM domain